jgi:hypothetical protein
LWFYISENLLIALEGLKKISIFNETFVVYWTCTVFRAYAFSRES